MGYSKNVVLSIFDLNSRENSPKCIMAIKAFETAPIYNGLIKWLVFLLHKPLVSTIMKQAFSFAVNQ